MTDTPSIGHENCTSSISGLPEKPLHPSPISRDILDSNDPPAEFNISPLREFVSLGRARRALLDSKIAPLKAELEKLMKEHDSLDAEIRKHEGALSPLRRMPTEIISLIFTFALPPFVSSYGVMGVQEIPWALSAVCSRWRKIVLSQPSFWTSLFIDFTDQPPESPSIAGLEPMLEAHLEASQHLPLNITFRTFYDHTCTPIELRVLELLSGHCHRWEIAELSGPAMLYSHLNSIRGDLESLRKLDITVQDEMDGPESDLSDLFESCPGLQEAFINAGRYGGDQPITAELPFSQLRRYSASNSWINHVHALCSASNLVDCVLRVIDYSIPAVVSTITLPQLLRLSSSTARILDCLDTPALQELYCCDQSSHLHSFLTRLPKLKKLFVGETPAAADIGSLLHAAPTITNLGLYLPMAFASDLFSILENPSQSPDHPPTIPALHSISIWLASLTASLPPLDQEQLMRAVESQWRDGCLRSVKFYAMRFLPSMTTLERMELIRGQGMEIVHFRSSSSLYADIVPEDFRLHNDHHDWHEHFLTLLEKEDCS
ncbi:hypothetical protein B0H13DRAFT_1992236 [Mycena leptocephala]|nr:hypothetical protein B0H13DRAFT_1992236 [Mycena leptocephala]